MISLWRMCWSRSTMHTCVCHVEQYYYSEEVMKEGFMWTASACVNIDNRTHVCFHRFVAMLTCDLVLFFLYILCSWFLWIFNFCFYLSFFVPLVFVVMLASFVFHVFCTCRFVCAFCFDYVPRLLSVDVRRCFKKTTRNMQTHITHIIHSTNTHHRHPYTPTIHTPHHTHTTHHTPPSNAHLS